MQRDMCGFELPKVRHRMACGEHLKVHPRINLKTENMHLQGIWVYNVIVLVNRFFEPMLKSRDAT